MPEDEQMLQIFLHPFFKTENQFVLFKFFNHYGLLNTVLPSTKVRMTDALSTPQAKCLLGINLFEPMLVREEGKYNFSSQSLELSRGVLSQHLF